MSSPYLVVQLSDPHIGADWADGDPVAALAVAVASVRAMGIQPDALLLTGDLADRGTDAEYEQVRGLLALLNAPTFVLPGNHDDRSTLRRHFELPDAHAAPVCYGSISGHSGWSSSTPRSPARIPARSTASSSRGWTGCSRRLRRNRR